MLKYALSMGQLPFSRVMEVYEETNREQGSRRWPDDSSYRQLALAEEDFYQYLDQSFFKTPESMCFWWEVSGKPVCALRTEPYRDGMLLTALETAVACRGKGYATALLGSALAWLQAHGKGKVYSHIAHGNAPSIAAHRAVGFVKISDCATMLDGSVTSRLGTYLYSP